MSKIRSSLRYRPSKIWIDVEIQDHPVTRRILSRLQDVPCEVIADRSELKRPQEATHAKKQLFLTRHRGKAVKACQGQGDYVCCNYLTMALVTDCHLECTYCILQDYLQNNPVISIAVDIENVFEEIRSVTRSDLGRIFRIGTGELSDSLALDDITGFSQHFVEFAREEKNILLELKTKSDCVDGLLGLDHQKRTVVSWSINPQSYIDTDEHKCASLEARLQSAQRVIEAGYPVAFNFDPLLHLDDWKKEYGEVLRRVAEVIPSESISWFAIGALRFTSGLKKVVDGRFPKSRIMAGEFIQSPDGKMRYFRDVREEMYQFILSELKENFLHVPRFLCMETASVWKKVEGFVPHSLEDLEQQITKRAAASFAV